MKMKILIIFTAWCIMMMVGTQPKHTKHERNEIFNFVSWETGETHTKARREMKATMNGNLHKNTKLSQFFFFKKIL
jgi:hypothetical protein